MGFGDWVRRLFSPSADEGPAEDEAALREEYGAEASGESAPGGVAGGVPGLAGLEDAQAAENAVEGNEPH